MRDEPCTSAVWHSVAQSMGVPFAVLLVMSHRAAGVVAAVGLISMTGPPMKA